MKFFKLPLRVTVISLLLLFLFLLPLAFISCKKNDGQLSTDTKDRIAFDSTKIGSFLTKYPEFKAYKSDFTALYRKHNFQYVWYDKDGRIDFAEVLYNQINQLDADGVPVQIPHKQQIDEIFADNDKAQLDNELLISAMYLFHTKKVIEGVDAKTSKSTGWFLPREKVNYAQYLDTLMKDPDLIRKDESEMISQYYHLKKGLQLLRVVKKNGGWGTITLPEGTKMLQPGDENAAIGQVRKRLTLSGELEGNTGSNTYDNDLKDAVAAYRKRNNILGENITPMLVEHMNIAVEDRIKTIIVNMERCRWITPSIADSKELIAVNIPAYQLKYFRDGKAVLESNVVVGNEGNKTVVFSGQMSYLVFSPYWNIPKSIIAKEIQPGIDKDKNYLEKHNMEWNGGNVRQKPGKDNSLGLVKFMFPNSNNIYLHDTPAKSLFGKDDRALSHGCVRVEKARELAIKIMDSEKNWNAKKIDQAMHAGKETNHPLDHKIPVYIAYFTAEADADGRVAFFPDVYNRDPRLAQLLYSNNPK